MRFGWIAPGVFALALAAPGQADTFEVDRTAAGGSICSVAADDCSLLGAISLANQTSAEDTIVFNIPMSDPGCTAATGVCRIDLGSVNAVPAINNRLIIDGYSQPGAQPNTIPAPGANNAQLKIELTSSLPASGASTWLSAGSTGLTLRGLAVFLPGGTAMVTGSTNSRVILQGNWFGVTAAGVTPDYTVSSGVFSFSGFGTGVTIGGPNPADRNVIAGSGRNSSNQIQGIGNFSRVSSTVGGRSLHLIQGNLFGLGPDGNTVLPFRDPLTISSSDDSFLTPDIRLLDNRFVRPPLVSGGTFGDAVKFTNSRVMDIPAVIQGNVFGLTVDNTPVGIEKAAIRIQAGNSSQIPRIRIGGPLASEANIFANALDLPGSDRGNAIAWSFLPSDSRIDVIGNRMLDNQGLGMDLPSPLDARTVNDLDDADLGANRLQNFPEISAFAVNGGLVNLSYRVDSTTANSVYPLRVDFYRAAGDEGEVLVATDSYEAASAQQVKSISFTPAEPIDSDDVIVAIATDAEGRSSEFSFSPIQLTLETPLASACLGNPHIFCDGMESGAQASLEVHVRASSTVFTPNGSVRLSDNRGATCTLTLQPEASPLTSRGSCILVRSGSPGSITITAIYNSFSGAFASATGGNVTLSQSFTISN